MTRTQLIKWSVARDTLNFIGIGQIPGLCWLLDLPLIVMHFTYAGPTSLFTLLETIPVIGFFPFFTIAALCYPDDNDPGPSNVQCLLPPERVAVRRTGMDRKLAAFKSLWAPEDVEVANVA